MTAITPIEGANSRRLPVFGIGVNVSSRDQALREIDRLRQLAVPSYVCFLEGNLLSRLPANPALREVLNNAALVYPDGVAVQKAMHWHYGLRVERVSGPSLLLQVCEYGQAKGWRHFFYGGAEGVAERMITRLRQSYPELLVAGVYSPPFRELTDAEEQEVVRMIEAARPDFLWVGLGGPKQEFWMAKYLSKIRVPLMLGVGAAFDFHSGQRPWAPAWMRRLGLEWLFRMVSGGRSTFRRNLFCVPKVALMLARERLALAWRRV